ncbi:isoleucine--tRNA ligase [Saccharothrix australiensis]|uniref:Isoleucine--tRNA ligase n=1 Tax=Saccharothrix australiensis TaxID=2072 RepID=A0A495VYI6_9PSEU|nr:isoleucine--tRNA ligase [Saccharothrix australiensis]RKT54491.1 isoleucyl-tRNA synthetase [Saccharothrix australiensis]
MPDKSPYTPLPPHAHLPAVDHEVLGFWRARNIFERSVERTGDGPEWVFYEGPPTANGKPGTHHVEARVFKDVFPRFKTMKGFHVPRRAGWDCHGLPVEIAVEKELGLSGKQDIEKVGIGEFNARCRESVQRYVGEFEEMTDRVGYWVDMSDAYWTMSPEYVDSVWWALKRINDRGLLVRDHRIAPYCPRCGTGLSDHEVAQGYESVVDPSVYVRMPVDGEVAGAAGAELLIWTTTPWTLVSNTAVAVHPDTAYVVARTADGVFVVAEPLLAAVLGEGAEVLASLRGEQLAGVRYRAPFDLVDIPDAHVVITADYVTTEDGTGLVHQAPAFGADDLAACRRHGLPVVNPIGEDGRFLDDVGLVGGVFFKEADALLTADLEARGLLFRAEEHEHQYPHCWRCHTPLMYYAQLSWYIRTTARRAELQRENERTNWHPRHIKHGRYGDWLANNVDWALSRNRYWGTPLPVWQCGNGHLTCVGSRSELGALAGADLSDLDPHRPFVDEVRFPCPECGERASRVPEVVDAWFDSGSMPFASIGYPYVEGSVERFEKGYPARFICEAIDQTRGWFYTLMAIGTLVFDRSSYEDVVCLGHIMAEDGRKMSKHLGNIIEPVPLMEKHGADALRWFMLCSGSPWSPRRVGDTPLEEIVRKVLLTYWNTASFFTLYASTGSWSPAATASPVAERAVNDRWVLAELHALVSEVDAALEDFDTARSGKALSRFVDDLSNWYVRRSRARFREGDPDALATLHECLHTLTRLLAPFVPFVTEHVWRHAIRPGDDTAPESVHLSSWPVPVPAHRDDELRAEVVVTRQVVEVGRAVRKSSKVRNRQPLRRALVAVPGGREPRPELLAEIADELNVREVTPLAQAGELVDVTVKPNFRALGRRFGPRTRQVAEAITDADHGGLARDLKATGSAVVVVDGAEVSLTPEDVLITEVPRTGWSMITQPEAAVALDTTVTPELRRAGQAREVVRLVQAARKEAGYAVTDRVRLLWTAEGETAEALREHEREIADTVLAVEVAERAGATEPRVDDELGLRFWLSKA